jgi:hypothetical protein
MSSTLNPACPLCGLRFANKPLLDLHIREDHRKRDRRAQNGHRDPGSNRVPPSPDNQANGRDVASTPSRATKEATARTTRRRPRASRAMSKLRRALRAHRHVKDGLLSRPRAAFRSHREQQPRPQAPARSGGEPQNTHPWTPAECADHETCLICRASVSL